VVNERLGSPVTMEETAAQVQTTTVLPSLKPSVCSANPVDESPTLAARPIGAAVHETRAASRKPVRHAAADMPKHAPAYAHHIPTCLHPERARPETHAPERQRQAFSSKQVANSEQDEQCGRVVRVSWNLSRPSGRKAR